MKINISDYNQSELSLPYDQRNKPWSLEYFVKYGCVLSSIAHCFSIDINFLIDKLLKLEEINPNMTVNAANVINLLIDSGFKKKGEIYKIFTDKSPTGYHYVAVDEEKKNLYTTFLMKPGIYDFEKR